MPEHSDSMIHGGKAGGFSPAFSDALLQNERAMWRAEFDSIGEEAVRGNVEGNSYPPTGMEVARQWLAEREVPQAHAGVRPTGPMAEPDQARAPEFPKSGPEDLADRIDANNRAMAEIAANAQKTARATALLAVAASLLALCAIVMVFVSWRQVAPIAKQASVQPSRPQQPMARPLTPVMPPAETAPVSEIPPANAQKEQLSGAPPVNSPDLQPEGQSAAQALALIADKLGGEGTINFTAQIYDMATGRDHTEQLSYRANNVTIDPNRCRVGYRWHVEQNGAATEQDRTVDLRLAKRINVTSINAEPNHRFVMHAEPKLYAVHIGRWDNASGDHLYFREAKTAERVAMAARRAVALCEDGKQQFPRR